MTTGRAAIVVGALAVLLAVGRVAPPAASDASFAARTSGTGALGADTPRTYLRVFTQGSDPAGLSGYATRRGSSPATPAATGSDAGVAAHLGGYDNVAGTATRVLTVQVADTLPSGVTSVTVTAAVAADASGRAPISGPVLRTVGASTGGAASVTLAAGAKRQLNLSVSTLLLPGTAVTYQQQLTLKVTYSGYTGAFLTYSLPIKVYDGTGAG